MAVVVSSARSTRSGRGGRSIGAINPAAQTDCPDRRRLGPVPVVCRVDLTVPSEHHPPVEEYLQVIESLTEEGAPVIQARIAERLGKSAPSVSEMLDRLTIDGYVERSGRKIT